MKAYLLIISLITVCVKCVPVKENNPDNPDIIVDNADNSGNPDIIVDNPDNPNIPDNPGNPDVIVDNPGNPGNAGDYKLEIESFPDTLALLSEYKVPVAFGEEPFTTIGVDENFGKMIYNERFWKSQDSFFTVIPTVCNYVNQVVFDIIATDLNEREWTYRDSVLIINPFSLSTVIDSADLKIISKVNVTDKFFNMYDSTYYVTWKCNNETSLLPLSHSFAVDYKADTEFLIEAYVSDKHNNTSCLMSRALSTMLKPIITKHPKDASVSEGGKIVFSVSVLGAELTYQWQKNGRDISGANDSLYEINDIKAGDGAEYRCIVFNQAGKDTADNAILQVIELPETRLESDITPLDFTLLSYNVAGLLEPFSSSSPAKNTPVISKLTNNYDIVLVQEDFNYHAALYKDNRHPHRTVTSGGMGFGDGLNIMSNFPYTDFTRNDWNNCSGMDCFTPKGFTWMRLRLVEGVYIDLYNVHANAGAGSRNYSARKGNINQLVNFAKENSKGSAVILAGDFNCRYTRSEDNIRSIANELSATDAWVEIVMNNNEPAIGSQALVCHKTDVLTDYSCEVVDKIFYRSNRFIQLEALTFTYEDSVFRDSGGSMLSDHRPIYTKFRINLNENIRMSDQFGGSKGTSFTDINKLPDQPVVNSIGIRTGEYVNQVSLTLSNGTVFAHGGNGGEAAVLALTSGEYVTSVKMCSGKKESRTRISYIKFSTNQGRSISGGTETGTTVTYTAKAGWQIVGFHGLSGDVLDKCGVIYAPIQY